ncbi:hypothetical protein [Spirochaeta isovalerica]|uniref:Phage tail collar domain-containing protein n=1 Tax=Spirochaeta isovalerica TaxID=150 RepID=A0A841R510_9SPIO|nr:hypothetical protein [Spirochaeta isovalerica]MBB6478481.1 hypothetical protein [Spirochaeta isovalerica]
MKKLISLFFLLFFLTYLYSQSEAMTISPTGNVGINVNDPSEKLDVDGNVKISGTLETVRIINQPKIFQHIINTTMGDVDVTSYIPTDCIAGDHLEFANIGTESNKLINVPVVGEVYIGECVELLWDDLSNKWLLISSIPSYSWPIGSTYIQFPFKKSPMDLGFPGVWEDISIDYNGAFFRANGGKSEQFEVFQEDGILNHKHSTYIGPHSHSIIDDYGTGGDKIAVNGGDSSSRSGLISSYDYGTKTSGNPTQNGTDENRPENYSIIIWERIE